ncbi:MAG: hypothetical protein R3C44_04155 [Chloroflexota bacterium]
MCSKPVDEFEETGDEPIGITGRYPLRSGVEEAGDTGFMADFAGWRATSGKDQSWTDDWFEDDIEDILDDRD